MGLHSFCLLHVSPPQIHFLPFSACSVHWEAVWAVEPSSLRGLLAGLVSRRHQQEKEGKRRRVRASLPCFTVCPGLQLWQLLPRGPSSTASALSSGISSYCLLTMGVPVLPTVPGVWVPVTLVCSLLRFTAVTVP